MRKTEKQTKNAFLKKPSFQGQLSNELITPSQDHSCLAPEFCWPMAQGCESLWDSYEWTLTCHSGIVLPKTS